MATAKRRMARMLTDEEEARIQAGIAQDPDNPEASDEELARMRPAREVLPPALYAVLDEHQKRRPGQRGPGKRPAKVPVTIRVDPDTLAAMKASGPGWQVRANAVLGRAAATGRFAREEDAAPKAKRRA